MAGQTLLITHPDMGTLDLETIAGITDWNGLLDTGPPKGDLLTFDFQGGAVWIPSDTFDAYTLVVPVVMRGVPEDVAIRDVLSLESYLGLEVTLTRRAMVNGELVDSTCQAVMTSRPTTWELDVLGRVPVTITFQALGPWT
jgi:hypothetical protein